MSSKTRRCNAEFDGRGKCPRGNSCGSAHDMEEMSLSPDELRRLRSRKKVAAAKKGNSNSSNNKNQRQHQGAPPASSEGGGWVRTEPVAKPAALCRDWPGCKRGDACKFAHGAHEVGTAVASLKQRREEQRKANNNARRRTDYAGFVIEHEATFFSEAVREKVCRFDRILGPPQVFEKEELARIGGETRVFLLDSYLGLVLGDFRCDINSRHLEGQQLRVALLDPQLRKRGGLDEASLEALSATLGKGVPFRSAGEVDIVELQIFALVAARQTILMSGFKPAYRNNYCGEELPRDQKLKTLIESMDLVVIRNSGVKGRETIEVNREAVEVNRHGASREQETDDEPRGYLFLCSEETRSEVFGLGLFGSKMGDIGSMRRIGAGTRLFCYDYSRTRLLGPFVAESEARLNIEAVAFDGRFPAQIRFKRQQQEGCLAVIKPVSRPVAGELDRVTTETYLAMLSASKKQEPPLQEPSTTTTPGEKATRRGRRSKGGEAPLPPEDEAAFRLEEEEQERSLFPGAAARDELQRRAQEEERWRAETAARERAHLEAQLLSEKKNKEARFLQEQKAAAAAKAQEERLKVESELLREKNRKVAESEARLLKEQKAAAAAKARLRKQEEGRRLAAEKADREMARQQAQLLEAAQAKLEAERAAALKAEREVVLKEERSTNCLEAASIARALGNVARRVDVRVLLRDDDKLEALVSFFRQSFVRESLLVNTDLFLTQLQEEVQLRLLMGLVSSSEDEDLLPLALFCKMTHALLANKRKSNCWLLALLDLVLGRGGHDNWFKELPETLRQLGGWNCSNEVIVSIIKTPGSWTGCFAKLIVASLGDLQLRDVFAARTRFDSEMSRTVAFLAGSTNVTQKMVALALKPPGTLTDLTTLLKAHGDEGSYLVKGLALQPLLLAEGLEEAIPLIQRHGGVFGTECLDLALNLALKEASRWALVVRLVAAEGSMCPSIDPRALASVLPDEHHGLLKALSTTTTTTGNVVAKWLDLPAGEILRLESTTAACEAVRLEKFATLRSLVELRPELVNAQDADGDAPIHIALAAPLLASQLAACDALTSGKTPLNTGLCGKAGKNAMDLCAHGKVAAKLREAKDEFARYKKQEQRKREKQKKRDKALATTATTTTASETTAVPADGQVAAAAAGSASTTRTPEEPVPAPSKKKKVTVGEELTVIVGDAIATIATTNALPTFIDDDDDDAAVDEEEEEEEAVGGGAGVGAGDGKTGVVGAEVGAGVGAADELLVALQKAPIDDDLAVRPAGGESAPPAAHLDEELEQLSDDDEEDDDDGDLAESLDFDGSVWDVEMTENVLRWFKRAQKKQREVVSRVIRCLRKLAEGAWNDRNRKQLRGAEELRLYEAKLDKGSRILWELAISFSERRSSRAGAIYTQTIRVWAVCLDHDNVSKTIDQICEAHRRGRGCHLKKQLRGLEHDVSVTSTAGGGVQRTPRTFAAVDLEAPQLLLKPDDVTYPPANPEPNAYTLLKFYDMSSKVARALSATNASFIDVPFKVTDCEHSIINCVETASTLLVGRSGTGKTTCCVFKMYADFARYWEMAAGPLLPRANDASKELHHLRQLFVTKSPVLRSEVERVFGTLRKQQHNNADVIGGAQGIIDHRLDAVPDDRHPLFLTNFELLRALDRSLPGEPFLATRKSADAGEAGSLGSLRSYFDDDDDSDSEEEEELEDEEEGDEEEEEEHCSLRSSGGEAREATFFEFFDLWPKINKVGSPLHPALVWTEIRSYIRGSVEAAMGPSGCLDLETYLELGKKRSSMTETQRREVYSLFLQYKKLCKRRGLWDPADLVHSLHERLREHGRGDIVIDAVFGDEIQDFTQAEIALLLLLCQSPSDLFLCGDSAQTIARGVGFRFADLRTLWRRFSEQGVISKATCLPEPKQLLNNYRSHKGCLRLAAAVIRIVYDLFPSTIDRLPPDMGVLDGPKPVLLETRETADLLLLLLGNMRATAAIEFGAHQVVLVRNEDARKALPAELKLALVMTVFEAKGLEFDDVLLYNFFSDSPADKEWRVVTNYADDEEEEQLKRVSNEEQKPTSRALAFNAEQHKMLESELKFLYTAITRARVNVWIYDDSKKREPMFELFRRRGLVESVTSCCRGGADKLGLFAKSTTAKEWLRRGVDFAKRAASEGSMDLATKRGLLKVAADCLSRGGAPSRARRAEAEVCLIEARELETQLKISKTAKGRVNVTGSDVRKAFATSARRCIEAGLLDFGAVSLFLAAEFGLAAELYEAMGKCGGKTTKEFTRRAAVAYKKAGNNDTAAARCYERLGEPEAALRILRKARLYLEEMELKERRGEVIGLELVHLTARRYAKSGQKDLCMSALRRLPAQEQADFLSSVEGFLPELCEVLCANGQNSQAANYCCDRGQFEEAVKCLPSSSSAVKKQLEIRAADAKLWNAWGQDIEKPLLEAKLVEAASSTEAQATELLARLRGDVGTLRSAVRMYLTNKSTTATLRLAFCSLQLRRLGEEHEEALVERCAQLADLAVSSNSEVTREALAFFAMRQIEGNDSLEMARFDARGQALIGGGLRTEPSPVSSAHLRVDQKSVRERLQRLIAALCVLMSRDEADRLLKKQFKKRRRIMEAAVSGFTLNGLMLKCSPFINGDDIPLLEHAELAEASRAGDIVVASSRLGSTLRYYCHAREYGERRSNDEDDGCSDARMVREVIESTKAPLRLLAPWIDQFLGRVSRVDGDRPTLDDYLEGIHLLHLRSRPAGRHGPMHARRELQKALQRHAKLRAAEIRRVDIEKNTHVDAAFIARAPHDHRFRASKIQPAEWTSHGSNFYNPRTREIILLKQMDPGQLKTKTLRCLGFNRQNKSLVDVSDVADKTVLASLLPQSLTIVSRSLEAGSSEVYRIYDMNPESTSDTAAQYFHVIEPLSAALIAISQYSTEGNESALQWACDRLNLFFKKLPGSMAYSKSSILYLLALQTTLTLSTLGALAHTSVLLRKTEVGTCLECPVLPQPAWALSKVIKLAQRPPRPPDEQQRFRFLERLGSSLKFAGDLLLKGELLDSVNRPFQCVLLTVLANAALLRSRDRRVNLTHVARSLLARLPHEQGLRRSPRLNAAEVPQSSVKAAEQLARLGGLVTLSAAGKQEVTEVARCVASVSFVDDVSRGGAVQQQPEPLLPEEDDHHHHHQQQLAAANAIDEHDNRAARVIQQFYRRRRRHLHKEALPSVAAPTASSKVTIERLTAGFKSDWTKQLTLVKEKSKKNGASCLMCRVPYTINNNGAHYQPPHRRFESGGKPPEDRSEHVASKAHRYKSLDLLRFEEVLRHAYPVLGALSYWRGVLYNKGLLLRSSNNTNSSKRRQQQQQQLLLDELEAKAFQFEHHCAKVFALRVTLFETFDWASNSGDLDIAAASHFTEEVQQWWHREQQQQVEEEEEEEAEEEDADPGPIEGDFAIKPKAAKKKPKKKKKSKLNRGGMTREAQTRREKPAASSANAFAILNDDDDDDEDEAS